MKRFWKKPLALLLAFVLLVAGLPIALAADEGAGFVLGDVNGANGTVDAVQGQFFYVYVYADQIQGLQSGSLVLAYDLNVFQFASAKSEPAKRAGLQVNPYADRMEFAAGTAAGYPDKEDGMGYVSFAFMMKDKAMQETEASIPARGTVPLYKFAFKTLRDDAAAYTMQVVENRVEVNEQLFTPSCDDLTVRVSKALQYKEGGAVGYFPGGTDTAIDLRFALTKPAQVVDTAYFAPPHQNPQAISTAAFGNTASGTKMEFLKHIVFGVALRSEAEDVAEYPVEAFSGLPALESIAMEFTEAEFSDRSRYFTDDGIIYRWDEDKNGNRLDTCRIYYIPAGRVSKDIYLSKNVRGFYGGTSDSALRSLTAEQVNGLVFHVFENVDFDGTSQKQIFSQQITYRNESGTVQNAQLHCVSYGSAAPVSEVSYHYNSGGELVIPLCFYTHTLISGSSAGLTQRGDSVVLSQEAVQAAARDALRSGKTSFVVSIEVSDGKTYSVTVRLTHEHTYDTGSQTKAPTCTEAGEKTFTCTICGDSFKEPVAALGHLTNTGSVTKEPTCTEPGVRTFTCMRCGVVLKTEEVPAKGHTKDTGTVVRSATCKAAGLKHHTCTVCGTEFDAEYNDSNAHIWTGSPLAWRCSICGEYRVVWNKPSSSYVDDIPNTEPPSTLPPETTAPTTTEPSTTEPSTTEPSTTEPSTTEPSTTEPSTTEPSTAPTRPTEPSTAPTRPTVPSTAPTLPTAPTQPTVPAPTEPVYMLGDVDGNGQVTTADARLALRAAVRLQTLDEIQTLSSDVDKDGKILSSDARMILRVAVRLDTFD